MNSKMNRKEKEYLQNYNIADYERPSVATDIVVFTMAQEQSANTRQHPEGKLQVLLINRASYPYKGFWALPGGFCRPNEEVYETARRELYEETGIQDAYLKLSGIYGEVDRDPRGWIISHAFLALVDGEKCSLRADTDAWEARWFDVGIEVEELDKKLEEDGAAVKKRYHLSLQWKDCMLTAVVDEIKVFKNCHESVTYQLTENNGIAFDHAKIMVQAFLKLQNHAIRDEKIIFDLMPERFTLTELQKVFEIILQRKLVKANFRRKIAAYVTETEEVESGRRYRSAKQFKRNVESFYEM